MFRAEARSHTRHEVQSLISERSFTAKCQNQRRNEIGKSRRCRIISERGLDPYRCTSCPNRLTYLDPVPRRERGVNLQFGQTYCTAGKKPRVFKKKESEEPGVSDLYPRRDGVPRRRSHPGCCEFQFLRSGRRPQSTTVIIYIRRSAHRFLNKVANWPPLASAVPFVIRSIHIGIRIHSKTPLSFKKSYFCKFVAWKSSSAPFLIFAAPPPGVSI